jgi:hypothetical protein
MFDWFRPFDLTKAGAIERGVSVLRGKFPNNWQLLLAIE